MLLTRMFVAALALSAVAALPAETKVKVGEMAPDFTLPSTQGGDVKLSQFRGQKNVVLAFYPAAFTGGCTKEMQAYQFNLGKFDGADTVVFGMSTDNTPSQRKFSEELGVNFAMLSDFRTREVSKTYGVLNEERGVANRTTFVVDKTGKVQHIEEGASAVDVMGAANACSRLAKH
ncbi:MAG: redoxin domain-containing protein [Acidobacteria bacterium]|nr:redoxin domain-containing protein [Acidobacteriota bacterium]